MTSQRSMQKSCTRVIAGVQVASRALAVVGPDVKSPSATPVATTPNTHPANARIGSIKPRSRRWNRGSALRRADRARGERHRGRPDTLIRFSPEIRGGNVEHDRGLDVGGQPSPCPDFVLELHGSPPGISRKPHHTGRALTVGDGLEHLSGGAGRNTNPDLELPLDAVEAILSAVNEPDLLLRNGAAQFDGSRYVEFALRDIIADQKFAQRHQVAPVDHPPERT